MRQKRSGFLGLAILSVILVVSGIAPVHAYSRQVNWYGNGVNSGEGFNFKTEICGIENGAPVDGAYIYWVLTASKANFADIDFDGAGIGTAVLMEKKGKGAFHKIQTFTGSLVEPTSVFATHDGPIDKKANLVVSHGCLGTEPELDGLIIQYRPADLIDDAVDYCTNGIVFEGKASNVCSFSPAVTLTGNDYTSGPAFPNSLEYNIPLSTLNSQNSTTGYFNIAVTAPASLPVGSIVGPGVGMTCLQRSGPVLYGSLTGALAVDWTGGGVREGIQYYYWWYSGCSLDIGVSKAYFYAYMGITP